MEIRGVGIVYLPDLYGADAVRRDSSQIDLVCQLEPWREGAEYERVGADRPDRWICSEPLCRCFVLPVHPAGSMATLVEIAIRETLQRRSGAGAVTRLEAALQSPGPCFRVRPEPAGDEEEDS